MMKNRVWRSSFTRIGLGLVLVGLFSLSGCGGSHLAGPAVTHGLALIEQVEVLLLESFPVQAQARITGFLQDNCTSLEAVTQERIGATFVVRVTTVRPADAICAAVVAPFEEWVTLDVSGLAAGTYVVDVNGVQATFAMTVDNIL